MTYKFNGTAVYVYGAKRQNHGAYSGQLLFTTIGLNLTADSATRWRGHVVFGRLWIQPGDVSGSHLFRWRTLSRQGTHRCTVFPSRPRQG